MLQLIIQYKTYSLSKATRIISRRSAVESPEEHPFDRIDWDMIHMTTGYNQDQYISYFKARKAYYKLVYTHASKSDAFQLFKKAINYIETQFHCKI